MRKCRFLCCRKIILIFFGSNVVSGDSYLSFDVRFSNERGSHGNVEIQSFVKYSLQRNTELISKLNIYQLVG